MGRDVASGPHAACFRRDELRAGRGAFPGAAMARGALLRVELRSDRGCASAGGQTEAAAVPVVAPARDLERGGETPKTQPRGGVRPNRRFLPRRRAARRRREDDKNNPAY